MDRRMVWELTARCGGVFKFTVLVQKRIQELVRGSPKLTEISSTDPIAIALQEIQEGLIDLEALSKNEIEEMQRSMEEQAAAQALLNQEVPQGRPGEPSTQAITEFLKS